MLAALDVIFLIGFGLIAADLWILGKRIDNLAKAVFLTWDILREERAESSKSDWE